MELECGYCLTTTETLRTHLKECRQMRYLIQELFKIEGMTLEKAIRLMSYIFHHPDEEAIKSFDSLDRS